jgi:hypothetical protein
MFAIQLQCHSGVIAPIRVIDPPYPKSDFDRSADRRVLELLFKLDQWG